MMLSNIYKPVLALVYTKNVSKSEFVCIGLLSDLYSLREHCQCEIITIIKKVYATHWITQKISRVWAPKAL